CMSIAGVPFQAMSREIRLIESSSAGVNSNFMAPAASDACEGFEAPGIATTASPQKLTSQLSATWLGPAPWAEATFLSSTMRGAVFSRVLGLIELDIRLRLLTPATEARSSWKRPERTPWASGE